MPDSCQVDFYVLAGASQSAERLACKLALMAWEQGYRVLVVTDSAKEMEELDNLMWEFPSERFLPHAAGNEGADSPVSIGLKAGEIPKDRDVVINLADDPVSEPGRFRRLLEIVPADSGRRAASRSKFRKYRELGLEPASHTLGRS